MTTAENAARQIAAQHSGDAAWLMQFAVAFSHELNPLSRILSVWGLNQSEAARVFRVTRQAISKWVAAAPPADRAGQIADLAAATDLLTRNLRLDRIPAVVRRPAAKLGGRSLLDLVEQEGSRAALEACRAMFAYENAHA